MDIYLRLLAERADEALARTEAAQHFAELVSHLDPAIIRRHITDDLQRASIGRGIDGPD